MDEYIKPLLKWWWLLLATTLLALGSSYYVVAQLPPVYSARTTLLIGRTIANPNPSTNEIWLAQQLSDFYAALARRDIVQEAAKRSLDMDWLPEYRVIPSSDSQLIEIYVLDTDPERAARVADELAHQLILLSPTDAQAEERTRREFVQQQLDLLQKDITETNKQITQKQQELGKLESAREITEAEQEIQALQTKLTLLQTNYSNLLASSQSKATNVLSIIEPAAVPPKPSGPNKAVIIGLAALFGLVLAGGASYLLEYVNQNLSSPEEITQELDLPLLGLITEANEPLDGSPYVIRKPRSIIAEAFRALRLNLSIAHPQDSLQTILLSSLEVGDGKTFVAINLASVYAQSGKRTIIVDADLHRPRVHKALNITNQKGLSEVLIGEIELCDAIQVTEDNLIRVIPAGDISKVGDYYYEAQTIETIVGKLKGEAEILIVDGMPLFVPETLIWSRVVDGVLLVVRPGHVRRRLSRAQVEKILDAGIVLLGVIVNRMRSSGIGFYNRYRYYYPYYGYKDWQEEGGGSKRHKNSAISDGRNGTKQKKQAKRTAKTPDDR